MGRAARMAISVGLVLLVVAIYFPTFSFDFVDYDDPEYVTENARVSAGLSIGGVFWALTAFQMGNWHPLTLLSHMADVTLFGLEPGSHHAVNVAWHAANAVLLFLFLAWTTGRGGPSVIVAALFAAHPLQVQSVAWIAQRKSLLSLAFSLLALLAYAAWVRRGPRGWYACALGAFVAALASKPMAITLPFLLLLADHWPLGRSIAWRRLWIEKIPFFAVAFLAALATWAAQVGAGAVGTLESFPLVSRVANALAAYLWYVGKALWPADLALFYPLSIGPLLTREALVAALTLLTATLLALKAWARWPFIGVGWLGYLVSLAPVVGLVQFGVQTVADRYAYVPLIGLFVLAVWGIDAMSARGPRAPRRFLAGLAVVAVAALAVQARGTLAPWRSTLPLLESALRSDPGNLHARINLGLAYLKQGDLGAAVEQLADAVSRAPRFAPARVNLGMALARMGAIDAALAQLEEATRLDPDDPRGWLALEAVRRAAEGREGPREELQP